MAGTCRIASSAVGRSIGSVACQTDDGVDRGQGFEQDGTVPSHCATFLSPAEQAVRVRAERAGVWPDAGWLTRGRERGLSLWLSTIQDKDGLEPHEERHVANRSVNIAPESRGRLLCWKQKPWSGSAPGCLSRMDYSLVPRSARNPVATTNFSRESARLAGGFMLTTLPNRCLRTT